MSTESPTKDTRAQPAASPSIFGDNENKGASISNGTTGTREHTNTNSEGYTYTIPIPPRDYVTTIKVPKLHWKSFLQKSRELGFTANELINQFISSVTDTDVPLQQRPAVTFNIAIAKAESKPVVNVGEFLAMKELDDLMTKVRQLRARAERERAQDTPTTFTVERAKTLESEIKKALRGVKGLTPEKLQEVEAALSILKSIREGRA